MSRLRHRTESGLSDRVLDEVTRRLVAALQPERIILYGSRARGDATQDSDVDLLVILSHSSERPARRAARAYASLRGLVIPADILVKTRAEFERYANTPGSLEHSITSEGRVLYG